MEELIEKYEKQIEWLNERLETAIYIGDRQKARIDTEIVTLGRVINDLRAMTEANTGDSGLHLQRVSKALPCGDEIWLKATETSRFNFERWWDELLGNNC